MTTGNTVKYNNVSNLVDRNIGDKLKELCIVDLIHELRERVEKFKVIIKRDYPAVDVVTVLTRKDYALIEASRLRYNVMYIHHCNKRIKDLEWMVKTRFRFYNYNNTQIFNLVKLKEKLSVENSLPF